MVVLASERLLFTPTIKNALWMGTSKGKRTRNYYCIQKDTQVTQIQTLLLAVLHCCHLSMHHENTQISHPMAIAGLGVALPERATLVAYQTVWHTTPMGATACVPPTTTDNLGWQFAKQTPFSSPVQLWQPTGEYEVDLLSLTHCGGSGW